MKRLIIILFILISINSIGQNIRGYKIEAIKQLQAHDKFILDQDSVTATTQINDNDTTLLTLGYLNSIKATRLDAATGLDTLKYMTPSNVALFTELNYVPYTGSRDDLYMDTFNLQAGNADLQTMRLDSNYTKTGDEPKGMMFFDEPNRTVSIALGNGVALQLGEERLLLVYNNSGALIEDYKICGIRGDVFNGSNVVEKATKHERYIALVITTEPIPDGSYGFAVELSGRVNNVNTGILSEGDIFLDTLGLISNTQGKFPDYNYPLGQIAKTGTTDGIIQFRAAGVDFKNSILDAFDGAARESFDFRTYSDGVNVYGVLTRPDGVDHLTLMFSTGWYDFVLPDTITLTAGSTTIPQYSEVWIDEATRTLQSGTAFPSDEHAEIAKIVLMDAASTQTDGALRNQNINNHLKYADNNGHIVHIGDRIRILDAQWEDGIGLTVSGTPTDFYVDVTSGHVWQMHLQSYEAQSMSTGDDIHIVNHPTSPYTVTTNMNTITTYDDGSTWNNEWQNLVIWGVCNKSGEISHLMVNLGSAGYLTEDNAVEDANNYTNFTIPRNFRGVGFLIARLSVRRSPAGYTYNPSVGFLDLRGFYPNTTAGGGVGSSGVTNLLQLLDTPSSYLGKGGYILKVNSGESAVEFSAPSSFLLTSFDSTGVVLHQSQIEGLADSLDLYVPYTGATADVDLDGYDIMADSAQVEHLRINQSSTAGYVWTATDAIGNGAWSSAITGMTYLGSWNASTNTPTLSDATGSSGHTYAISVTGTRDLGSGSITWTAGGFAIHNGSVYEYIGSDAVVSSVNGLLGNVELYPERTGNLVNIVGNTTTIDISDAPAVSNNTDSITAHNTRINNNLDLININLDSIIAHNLRLLELERIDTTGLFHVNRTDLDLVSGTNTGDQDISGIATNAQNISDLQDTVAVHLDTLQSHNLRIISNTENITANTTKIDSFITVADVATVLDAVTGIVTDKRITPNVFSTAFAVLYENTDKEVPSGLINGINDTYTVSRNYIAYTTEVFKNGVEQTINIHYTEIINGIVMNPDYLLDTGDIIEIKYRY